jgi:hypothetical protein
VYALNWPEIAILLTVITVFVSAGAIGAHLFLRAVKNAAREGAREGSKRP